LKKKIKSPHRALAANLLGEERARRLRDSDTEELLEAVTVKNGKFRITRR